jgi:glycosyltransferase involved in cell wall biosynthesis
MRSRGTIDQAAGYDSHKGDDMHIALIHYAAPPVVGGVEAVMARQAEQLSRAGHAVRVLAGRGAAWDPDIPVIINPLFDSRQARILEMKADLDRGVVPGGFDALVAEIFRDLLASLAGVEIVIAHNVASLHKNLALTAALYELSQTPGAPRVVLWHHDLAWTAARYQTELHPGLPWDLLRQSWPGVKQVVVSQARRAELCTLMGIPQSQVTVIPSGMDVPGFARIRPETWKLAQGLGLDRAAPLLLAPVRLTRRKNLEQGLRIAAAMRLRMPQVALVITGPPGAHNPDNEVYFRELLALRKEFGLERNAFLLAELRPEGLSDDEMIDFYHLADALLVTSREEGFGIPVLEAGLARLPIFCTDLPSLRGLAGEWATYFSPDDPAETVAGAILQRLARDPIYRMNLRVRSGFSWQTIYTQYLAPLLEAL